MRIFRLPNFVNQFQTGLGNLYNGIGLKLNSSRRLRLTICLTLSLIVNGLALFALSSLLSSEKKPIQKPQKEIILNLKLSKKEKKSPMLDMPKKEVITNPSKFASISQLPREDFMPKRTGHKSRRIEKPKNSYKQKNREIEPGKDKNLPITINKTQKPVKTPIKVMVHFDARLPRSYKLSKDERAALKMISLGYNGSSFLDNDGSFLPSGFGDGSDGCSSGGCKKVRYLRSLNGYHYYIGSDGKCVRTPTLLVPGVCSTVEKTSCP